MPAAFVVRGDTIDGHRLDEAIIKAAFDGRLARYKHPKRVVFVDAVPRNAMGKVQTDRLRRSLAGASA